MDNAGVSLLPVLSWGDPVDDDGNFLLPVGTVTLLLADVEGSTRGWELDEADMAAAMEAMSATVNDCVGRNHGVRPLEQGEGDSFLAAFARASEAVACALDIQRALAGGPIQIRIGIHSGEALRRTDKTYVGPAVNRAARLRDVAHGGQVVLSEATAALVADRMPDGSSLRDLGRHRLKDLARPEQVLQLVHPDLRREFPSLRTLDTYVHNLPEQRTPLFGRHAEIADIRALLAANRLVTLHGAGGCGKTRLAVEVAAAVLDEHSDGVFFVDLSSVRASAEITTALLAVLGLGQENDEVLVPYLGDKVMLLVIDNCEHLIEAVAGLVERVLNGTPGVRVLCTSREPLAVSGEVTFRVATLPVPPAEVRGIEALAPFAATMLFVDRARRVRSDFDPSETDAQAIAEICRRLDGMPLAIELAASRVRAFTPEDIARGLDERFRILTGGARTALPRQQTLEASVEWSHDLLTNDERAVFRRLAVFAGSFDLDAARAVCAVDGIEAHQVVDLLGLLVDKSLVISDGGHAESRFRLLETLRAFAQDRLLDAAEFDAAALRHRGHFLAVAERLGPIAGDVVDVEGALERAWAQLDADYDNLRAAVDVTRAEGDLEVLARFAIALGLYVSFRRNPTERIRWFGKLRRHLDEVSLEAATDAAFCLGNMFTPEVGPTLEQALATFVADGRDGLAARAALSLGSVLGAQAERRMELVQDCLARARSAEDRLVEGAALSVLIGPLSWQLPYDVEPYVAATLELARFPGLRGICRHFAASSLRARGDYRRARELIEMAAPDRATLAGLLGDVDLAHCLVMFGEMDADDAPLDRQLARATALHDHETVGRVLLSRAVSAAARGEDELDKAADLARASLHSLADAGTSNSWMFSIRVRSLLASWEVARGRFEAARDAIETATSMCVVEGARPWVDIARASVARAEGDHEATERATFDALESGQRFSVYPSILTGLELLAGLAVATGEHDDAARLLGAASAMRDQTGELLRLAPFARWHREDDGATRAALGEDTFREHWEAGAATPWPEMVAWALRGRGQRKRPPSGWASLTPTERQVVELVVDGLSNKDVGERLFVSARTVATHLRSIYAKLDVATRTELAAAHRRRATQGG